MFLKSKTIFKWTVEPKYSFSRRCVVPELTQAQVASGVSVCRNRLALGTRAPPGFAFPKPRGLRQWWASCVTMIVSSLLDWLITAREGRHSPVLRGCLWASRDCSRGGLWLVLISALSLGCWDIYIPTCLFLHLWPFFFFVVSNPKKSLLRRMSRSLSSSFHPRPTAQEF